VDFFDKNRTVKIMELTIPLKPIPPKNPKKKKD